MSTNYYLHDKPPCECCGRGYKPIHIGLSAKGWCFQLHSIEGLSNWDEWSTRLADTTLGDIRDEYDRPISYEELADIVKLREGSYDRAVDCGRDYTWYATNHAEKGPRGLVRNKVDGVRCVGHDGDVDLIAGEFS